MITASNLSSLPKFKQTGTNRFVACCPAHEDSWPSLSITQASNKVLVHCFAGCSQSSVIDALQSLGLWKKYQPKSHKTQLFTTDELEYMAYFCLAWNGAGRRHENPSAEETALMQGYVRALSKHATELYGTVVRDAYGR